MAGTTISSSTITTSITLTSAAANPILVTAGGTVRSTLFNRVALEGAFGVNWTLTNYGTITGSTFDAGVYLLGSSSDTLFNHGKIAGSAGSSARRDAH